MALREYVGRFNGLDHTHFGQAISNEGTADWMAANVPRFECPDKEIEEIYHFRWWTFRKHIKDTPDGFVITEFLPKVDGAENTTPSVAPRDTTFAKGAGSVKGSISTIIPSSGSARAARHEDTASGPRTPSISGPWSPAISPKRRTCCPIWSPTTRHGKRRAWPMTGFSGSPTTTMAWRHPSEERRPPRQRQAGHDQFLPVWRRHRHRQNRGTGWEDRDRRSIP